MNLKINPIIHAQTKVSYAMESTNSQSYEIDCGEGINLVMIPPKAQEAFNELTFDMLRPYPHSSNIKDSIKTYWKAQNTLTNRQIILCDGSISALYLINRLFLEKGDFVMGYVPQFSEYETDVKMYGAIFEGIPLSPNDNFHFYGKKLIEKLSDKYKLVYLDNPNNPTGQVIPLAEIEKILITAQKSGIAVIVDEAYGDYMPKENSAITLCKKYDNLIVVRTFSKGFGLAGLRAGYLIVPKQLTDSISNITNPYTMSELSRSVAAKTIMDETFLGDLQTKTAQIKIRLYQPWKNISIAETCDTVSICLLTHKNPDIDLAAEFAKRGILVISGNDFYSISKNSVRFRVPESKDMDTVLNVLSEIDRQD